MTGITIIVCIALLAVAGSGVWAGYRIRDFVDRRRALKAKRAQA